MYRKIVWCYLIVLTLLDISLNTKLSAQGKSHGNGASVHESLMEGISLQEWSSSEGAGEGGTGAGAGSGGAVLTLQPTTLAFGQRALAAAHALRVTITNTANETVHLASVAGTTPDFHASFFESKTLAPQANTSFSVVYLGRREGPTAAHLYIHTSKGVHKYPVSAVGVASEWRVWPLVGLRVPHNATLEPLLTLYNPTETTIQVQEVYSSGAWLGLSLPEGGEAAPRAAWTLPPHCARALVRLSVRLPPASPSEPRAAYIRIKGNMRGGGLVVGVEATPAPAGEYLSPVQLRLRTRGSMDPPDSVWIEAGSSSPAGAELGARVTGACRTTAHVAPHAPPPPPSLPQDKHTHNGAKADTTGIHISLVREEVEPMQELKPTAQITLDYAKMWAGYLSSLENGSASNGAGGGGGRSAKGGAYCTGWVTVGRAALPYSVRLLPGTMVLEPTELHFITCNKEESLRARALIARNDFPEPLLISHIHFPPEVLNLFHAETMAPMELKAGSRGVVARLRLKEVRPGPLYTNLALHTNLSDYTLPLLLYEGVPTIEFEWVNSLDGVLRLGALGAGERSSRRVSVHLRNRASAPLCITRLHVKLPAPAHASLLLLDTHPQASCMPAGGSRRAVLTVRVSRGSGGGEEELAGAVLVHTKHGVAAAAIRLTAHPGALLPAPVQLSPAAPYMPGVGALEVENSMSLRMRVTSVTPQHRDTRDRALTYIPSESEEIVPGVCMLGHVIYEPSAHCHPRCYTGLQVDTPEGVAWMSRGVNVAGLEQDASLQRARYNMFLHTQLNFTLLMHTTEVVGVSVQGSGTLVWPRVRADTEGTGTGTGEVVGRTGLVGVGTAVPLVVRVHNPGAHPLLLQSWLAVHTHTLGGFTKEETCVGCVWSADSFLLGEWRVTRGSAVSYRPPGAPEPGPHDPPYLLLQPGAEVELTVTFTPSEPADLAAYLYLRNNLTIVERVLVRGRGALPSFELGGRRPNSTSPIVLEVGECGAGGAAGGTTRALALRNTGRVPLRLRSWRVGGLPCGGRAFRVSPCGPVRLAPGEVHTLHVQYGSDWTRARAHATLSVRVGTSLARFSLAGLTPAHLLRTCASIAQRAPFEEHLRAMGFTLAVLALIGALGLGAIDAERALRRHRSTREAAPAGPPLDLRAIGRTAPPPPAVPAVSAPPRPAPPPPRRRRAARGRAGAAGAAGAVDAVAERLAFSRWRAGTGVTTREDSHSSEEGDGAPPPPAPPPPHGDAESSSPDSSPPPRDSYSSLSRRAEEEEGASSGEDSSSPSPSPSPSSAPTPHAPPQGPVSQAAQAPNRGSRQRRSSAEARRSERKSAERGADTSSNGAGPPRPPAPRPQTRGGRTGRRRGERASSPAPRPVSPEPRAPPAQTPHPAVRWGASWSDVVSRGNAAGADDGGGDMAPAPLAPIGSDVRRRFGSHSLFYYGSAPTWPPATPPAPPAPLAPGQYPPRVLDARWNEDENGGYRSLESLWGSSVEPLAPGAAWLWGGGGGAPPAPPAACPPVRPPPGFTAPRPVRPYDPFQSLASIWTPAALDWRLDSPSPPPPPVPGPPPPGTPPLGDDKPETPAPAN